MRRGVGTLDAAGIGEARAFSELLHRDMEPLRQALSELGLPMTDIEVQRVLRAARAQTSVGHHADAVTRLDSTVSPATARAIQATENATRAIEEEFGLLDSAAVAEILGSRGSSHRSFAAERRKRGELLYLRRLNSFVYPGFQFDLAAGRVKPVVALLIEAAQNADWDVEDVTNWLCSPTTYLGGERPVDHFDDAQRVLDVARNAWNVAW